MNSQQELLDRSVIPQLQALEELRRRIDLAFAHAKDVMRIVELKSLILTDSIEDHQAKFIKGLQTAVNSAFHDGDRLAKHLIETTSILQQQALKNDDLSNLKDKQTSKLGRDGLNRILDDPNLSDSGKSLRLLALSVALDSQMSQQAGDDQPADEEKVFLAFDWAAKALERAASDAQEMLAHRRALLQEMAARQRQIDQRLAKTSRTLDGLIAG